MRFKDWEGVEQGAMAMELKKSKSADIYGNERAALPLVKNSS